MKEINPFASISKVPKIDDAGQAAAARRHVLWRKPLSRPHRSRLPDATSLQGSILTTASALDAFGRVYPHNIMDDPRQSSP